MISPGFIGDGPVPPSHLALMRLNRVGIDRRGNSSLKLELS